MRQIILDTETTGLDPREGHRIIEIGCVELLNRRITGDTYHVYIQPDREIEREAVEVHGITNAFLKDKPRFNEVTQEFLDYVKGAELIIHNAPFDVGFIDAELKKVDKSLGKITDYCDVLDTLKMARQKHMGQRNSLDALCKRYGVDNTNREWHGALLDSELLAKVYLAMTGGQSNLFGEEDLTDTPESETQTIAKAKADFDLLVIKADEDELKAHKAKLESLGSEDW